ncbi:hypothetical protein TGFOU_242435B, partial [Toxoplasma gondii FOU]
LRFSPHALLLATPGLLCRACVPFVQPIVSAWTGRCLLSLRMHWPALLPLAAELLCRFSLSLPPKRSTLPASPTALACLLCAHASQGNSPGLQKDSFAPSEPRRVAPASANATTPALSSPSEPPRSTVSVTVFLDREESQPGSLKFLFQPALQGSRPGIPLRHALHVLSARRGNSNSPPRTNTPDVCTPDQAAPDSEVFIRSWNSHFAWMNAYRAGLSTFLEDVGNMHGLSGICSSSPSKRGGNVAHFEGQERPWLLDVPADAGAPASGRLQTSTPSACAASPHASGRSISPRFEFHADATGFFSRKSLYKTAVYAGVAGFPAVAARCLSACAAAAVTPETFAWLTALAATLRAEAALARNAGNSIFSEGFTGASRPVLLGQTDVETALAASPHVSAEPAVENLSGFREGGNESEEQLSACSMHALPGGTVSGDACAGGLAHAPPASFDSPKERQQTKCGVRNAAGRSDAFAEALAQAREAVREAERHWTLAPESLETLRRREEHFLGEGRSSSCGKPHPLLYAFTKGRSALVTALLSFLAFCGDVAHGKTVSRRAPLSPSSTGTCRSEETPKTAASEQSTRATSRAKLFPGREMTAEASEEHAESLHPGGCARAPLPAHAECEQEIFKETLDLLENLRNQFGSLEVQTFSSEFGVSSELSLKSNPTPSGRGAQDSDACDGVASPGLLEGAVSEDEAVEGADGEPGEERDFSEPRAPLHASTDPYAPVQTVKKEVTEEGVSSTEANEQVESARDLEVEDAGFVKCEEGRRWISSETTACLTAEVELEQEVSMDCSSSGSKSFSASRTADRRKCFTPVAENRQMTASFTEQEREAGPQDSGGRFDPGDETRSPLFFCWNEDADGKGSSPLLRRAFPRDLLRQAAALVEQCIYTPFPLPPRIFNPKCLPWVAVRAVLSGEEEAARGRCVFPVVMFTGELRDAEAQTLAAWAFVRLRISLAIGVGFFQQAALHGTLHAKDKAWLAA